MTTLQQLEDRADKINEITESPRAKMLSGKIQIRHYFIKNEKGNITLQRIFDIYGNSTPILGPNPKSLLDIQMQAFLAGYVSTEK